MIQKIHFHKMQASGNDYIYINTFKYTVDRPEEKAIRWSRPHTGIGSDGLVLIGPSDKADFSMRIFNADGSEAAMCGNASRCIGKYVYEQGLTEKTNLTLETLSGIKTLQLHTDRQEVKQVTVDMGIPRIQKMPVIVRTDNGEYEGYIASMGNPHFVIIVDDLRGVDLATVGPLIEHDPAFPDRTNVEFAEIIDPNNIRMRVWERGSGITQACGTGACATLAVCADRGKTDRRANLIMDGGTLAVRWDENDRICMTGTAETVFEGDIDNQ
jgi:diaminopimelate epimerase